MGMPEWVIMPRGNFQTSGCTIQKQTTDPVDLLRDDHLTRLEVGNHAQQFWPVRSSARCLFPVDCCHIVSSCSRPGDYRFLASEILLLSTHLQIHPSGLDRVPLFLFAHLIRFSWI